MSYHKSQKGSEKGEKERYKASSGEKKYATETADYIDLQQAICIKGSQ